MRFAQRAGLPVMFAGEEEESTMDAQSGAARGGDFPHYIGRRNAREAGPVRVVKVHADGRREDLNPRFDLANKSPDGFQWGYEGSGPAQLALAICADVLEDDREAVELFQMFKRRSIATIRHDSFRLTALEVRGVLDRIKEERANG